MSRLTALILDGDVGFVLALAQELRRRHISAFPSCTVRQAQSMLTDLHLGLDALVINCANHGACAFIERIAREHPKARIMGITSERHRCQTCSKTLVAQFREPEDKEPD